ncbi:MAG: hypothetical protein K8J08_16650 [Thermoanaerobaculia bacterium]|nr:hypothetical protein [Thermoanaerobaculia bacterium]
MAPGVSRGEPGWQDNWALSGATTDSALASGQDTGVAAGALERDVSHVVIRLGGNDFLPWAGAYDEIYFEVWDQPTIDLWIAGRIDNLRTMLEVIVPTGVGVVLLDVIDYSIMPALNQGSYGDPLRRELVATAVGQFSDAVRDLADEYDLVFLDTFALGRAIFGTNLTPRPTLLVGNVPVDLTDTDTSTGEDPTAAFVHDGIHPNTVLQGIWANAVAAALNLGYATGIAPLSEEEILAAAGRLWRQ